MLRRSRTITADRYKRGDPHAGRKYGDAIGDIVDDLQRRDQRLAALIFETCPSVGGQIIRRPDIWKRPTRTSAASGICIADEVQTAYGRMGEGLYAFEAQGVVPDIVVLGKPIGNGYPLGAVVTTRRSRRRSTTGWSSSARSAVARFHAPPASRSRDGPGRGASGARAAGRRATADGPNELATRHD